jgi:hypothetical protein
VFKAREVSSRKTNMSRIPAPPEGILVYNKSSHHLTPQKLKWKPKVPLYKEIE